MTNKMTQSRSLFPFGPFWDDALGAGFPMRRTDLKLRPALDVEETDDAIKVSIELPGLEKDDVNVSIEDGVLTVSGEKTAKSEAESEESNYHIIERTYGSFARSLSLPAHVSGEKANAKFDNGVLLITLPKLEQARPKRLEID